MAGGQRPPAAAAWVGGGVLALVLTAWWWGPGTARWAKDHLDDRRVARLERLIVEFAEAQSIEVDLVRAVVRAESGGDPRAKSNRGARGLMQITAITEEDVLRRNPGWSRGDLYDPAYNLKIGTAYLAYLLERFDGDRTLALTAYHMGPTAVRRVQRRHPGITPSALLADHAGPQTRAYVRRVLREVQRDGG
ncbi:MAG: lytic transglycosylase domain-containing protein [Planctomycetota bacterium]